MNQLEQELARKIVRHLDYGLDRLAPATRDRLSEARGIALSHYRERPETTPVWAWAGQAAARVAGRLHYSHWVAALATLVIATASVIYWQNTKPANELAELDTNLLTDELPINAYLDKGFDSWLKRSPR